MLSARAWDRARPWPLYLMAGTVPVSIAATNVAKALALLFGLVALAECARARAWPPGLVRGWTVRLIGLSLAVLALSGAWAVVPWPESFGAWSKHAKLLLVPLCLLLLRSRRDALLVLGTFIAVEIVVIASSWLLWSGMDLPWARADRNAPGTVFTSYLDQSMLTGLVAVVCLCLRHEFPGRHGRWIAAAIAVAAALNVALALPGRSGQLALLAMSGLALWWSLSSRTRWVALLAPALVLIACASASEPFRDRAMEVLHESQAFAQGGDRNTSAGQRLEYWTRSIEAVQSEPLNGFGAGSWNAKYRELAGADLLQNTREVRNPHQEYLLWSVELGVGGALLLLGIFVALLRDVRGARPADRRAVQAVVAYTGVLCLVNSALFDAVTGEGLLLVLGALLALATCTPSTGRPTPASTSERSA